MTSAAATTPMTIRAMTDADQPAVLRLLTASLAGGPTGERTAEFFAWKHITNPFGRSVALVAEAGDDVVAVRLLMRWGFLLGGRRVAAVRAVDTATHPEWQGRGLFRKLTMAALQAVDAEGVALVFNTPNANSRPGYLKMGWREVGDVPLHVRPARPVRFARGVLHGVGQEAVTERPAPVHSDLVAASTFLAEQGAAVADLIAGVGEVTSARLTTERSSEFLTWRYGQAPGLDYRVVPIWRDGALVGLGLGRLRRRGPLAEFTLGDVIAPASRPDIARAVLRAAARSGTDHVVTHLSPASPAAAQPWRVGYVPMPRAGLGLVVNPRAPLGLDPGRLDSWRLCLGDLEVF